jgi:small subunit ribosomal protein S19
MAKIYLFKGKTVEELQKMPLDEFAKLIPSRRRRSLKRGLTIQQKKLLERLRKRQKAVKTHVRDMVIIPEMIGKRILIYSGKDWVTLDVTGEMLGHVLGEFAQTRKKVMHSAPGVGATKSSKFLPLK